MPLSASYSFEKRNRCSMNVYQIENSKLISLYHSKNRTGRHKANLFRLMDNQNSHYCLIKNFSKLINFLTMSRMKHDKGPKSRFCRNCFHPIIKKIFKKHVFRFAKITHHLRVECLLNHHHLSSSIGRKHKSVSFLFMLP